MNPIAIREFAGPPDRWMLVVREKCEQIDNLAGFQLVLKLLRHERHVADLEGVDLVAGNRFGLCRLEFFNTTRLGLSFDDQPREHAALLGDNDDGAVGRSNHQAGIEDV